VTQAVLTSHSAILILNLGLASRPKSLELPWNKWLCMRSEVLTVVKIMLVFCADLSALKMETAYFSEMLVSIYKSTQHYNPEDQHWQLTDHYIVKLINSTVFFVLDLSIANLLLSEQNIPLRGSHIKNSPISCIQQNRCPCLWYCRQTIGVLWEDVHAYNLSHVGLC
jgi:hypothetical protein